MRRNTDQPPPTVPVLSDGRQSPRALAIQRGTCRLLRALDFASVTELTLAGGRRADIAALGAKGDIWIVEIKSSIEDFRVDQKWSDYQAHCDRLFFAVNEEFPQEILPSATGIIVADSYGATIIRDAPENRLSAARRKAVLVRFARMAAHKLHGLADPGATEPPR
ncbi:MAG: MmcB family DNA repair protein [Alphaproteobacteria bacterium]